MANNIDSTLQEIEQNLSNAYATLENKGVTISSYKNFENLATNVEEIPPLQKNAFTNIVSRSSGSARNLDLSNLNIMHIRGKAFYMCEGYETITLPNYLNSIGEFAFSGCYDLYSIDLQDVRTIGNCAFLNCNRLAGIDIPASTTALSTNVFQSCSNLERVTFLGQNLSTIPSFAFYGCVKLPDITIPNSVMIIGDEAFENCSNLSDITLGGNLNHIESYAFYNCNKLSRVNYIGNIASWCGIVFDDSHANPLHIAHNLYLNDQQLTNLVIPNTITEIKAYAFTGATLTSIDISSNILSIGGYAFEGCTGLDNIYVRAITPPVLMNAYALDTNYCPIYVPANSVNAYKTATNWVSYASRIQAIPE